MKKLMFLTMMFGLMMVFGGSAAAQEAIYTVGDGAGTPAKNHQFKIGIHMRINNAPEAPKGSKYITLGFLANGKSYAGALTLKPVPDQSAVKLGNGSMWLITNIQNPVAIQKYDNLKQIKTTFSNANNGVFVIEVVRSNKSIGTMTLTLIRQ